MSTRTPVGSEHGSRSAVRIDACDVTVAKRASYDREFEPAIREGLLTVQEAIRRGNRRTYATHIGRRFQLSEEMALRVTDNRARLTDSLRSVGRIPGHPEPKGGVDAPRGLQVLTMVLGLLALSGLFSLHEWRRQREMGRQLELVQLPLRQGAVSQKDPTAGDVPAVRKATIERDEWGRITRVSAGHPADVLDALCQATPFGACGEMEIQPTEPPFPGQRVGRFGVVHAIEPSEALAIRRDRKTGRWVAGTGLHPILTAEDGSSGTD